MGLSVDDHMIGGPRFDPRVDSEDGEARWVLAARLLEPRRENCWQLLLLPSKPRSL